MSELRVIVNEQPSTEVAHRFRNFAEAVQRTLGALGEVVTAEADSAATELHVRRVKASSMGEVRRIIVQLLRTHGFGKTGEVVRA